VDEHAPDARPAPSERQRKVRSPSRRRATGRRSVRIAASPSVWRRVVRLVGRQRVDDERGATEPHLFWGDEE
jgi:hypothetical protein